MKKIFLILLLLGGLFIQDISACTTAIVSGKYTKDGKPLLWKNRDTWSVKNKIMHFKDGKYECTGLVNSADKKGLSIWIGFNSAGFAIMNSASYNLNNDTIKQAGLEGRLMKKALQNCANIDEFEQMLKDLPQPTRLEANFGVIDAQGGAAYFELSNFKYVKIDANDPCVAPYGYLIRTNYSMTGKMGVGGGYIRYVAANKVFDAAVKKNNLSAETILQQGSRDLKHGLTEENLWNYKNLPAHNDKYVSFIDFIPRSGSSSSIVVEGVNKGENPENTVMWTILGFPLTSVIIPLWLQSDMVLPQVVSYNKKLNDSPLCHYALTLKKDVYAYHWGTSSKNYINVNVLLNADKTGFMQVLPELENQILNHASALRDDWENKRVNVKELNTYYQWIDQVVTHFYSSHYPQLNKD
jgi:hypothetical protein